MGIASACMFVFAELMARPLAMIFASYDQSLLDLTVRGFRIYSISFLRTIVFEVILVILIPLIFGIDGIWISIDLARLLSVMVTLAFLVKYRSKYHYY